MLTLTAQSPTELLTHLRSVEIAVLARTEGRTPQHCERWSICRFLGSYANEKHLQFPLELIHRERPPSPDFELRLGNLIVGVEVTEATHRDYAWAKALAAKIPGALLEPCMFIPGSQIQRGSGVRPRIGRIQRQLVGRGWRGLEMERTWVQFVMDAVDDKTHHLGSQSFHRFDEDWLLIYDNTPCTPRKGLFIEKAAPMLRDQLETYWNREPHFVAIFVETGGTIVELTCDALRSLPVIDVSLHHGTLRNTAIPSASLQDLDCDSRSPTGNHGARSTGTSSPR